MPLSLHKPGPGEEKSNKISNFFMKCQNPNKGQIVLQATDKCINSSMHFFLTYQLQIIM